MQRKMSDGCDWQVIGRAEEQKAGDKTCPPEQNFGRVDVRLKNKENRDLKLRHEMGEENAKSQVDR